MTGSLVILKPGLMTSIQDLGRTGLAYYAIPHSGVMDRNAARIALLLLNQSEDHPVIECTSIAPEIKFETDVQIAITGSEFNWTINKVPVVLNSVLNIKAGDTLKGKFAKNGLRGYIAIRGGLHIDKVYDSYATYVNAGIGGHEGRLLKKGDRLYWDYLSTNDFRIPIHKGPEYVFLTDLAKVELIKNTYTISAESNRMGVRLEGAGLDSTSYQLDHSAPVLPGFIQLPPSGRPIIVLQDGQTTGGYPRIAYIPDQYLSRLNQVPLGGEIRFVWVK